MIATYSFQRATPLAMNPQKRAEELETFWTFLAAGLAVATHRSRATRLQLILVPTRNRWAWTLDGPIAPSGSMMAGVAAESLVCIARRLPLQQSGAEMAEAYVTDDAKIRVDIIDVSRELYVAEFTSHQDLAQFAESRCTAGRLH